jgi:hypothetical protein
MREKTDHETFEHSRRVPHRAAASRVRRGNG